MARRYDKVVVRKVNGLVIMFTDPRTCYVKWRYGINIYERWFVRERNFYSDNWRPFSEYLKQNANIDIGYINRLARLYNITISSTKTMPDLTEREVREIPPHGRERNRHY
jgi:hypothetical protein